jgi:aconitate hydratase
VKSFARIHKANLINYGIIPITFKNQSDYDLIENGDILRIDNIDAALKSGEDFSIIIKKTGKKIEGLNSLDERSRAILQCGGLAVYTRKGGQ